MNERERPHSSTSSRAAAEKRQKAQDLGRAESASWRRRKPLPRTETPTRQSLAGDEISKKKGLVQHISKAETTRAATTPRRRQAMPKKSYGTKKTGPRSFGPKRGGGRK